MEIECKGLTQRLAALRLIGTPATNFVEKSTVPDVAETNGANLRAVPIIGHFSGGSLGKLRRRTRKYFTTRAALLSAAAVTFERVKSIRGGRANGAVLVS